MLKGDNLGTPTYWRNSEQWKKVLNIVPIDPSLISSSHHHDGSPGPEDRVWGDKGSCCIPFLFSHPIILLIYCRLQSGFPFSWPQDNREKIEENGSMRVFCGAHPVSWKILLCLLKCIQSKCVFCLGKGKQKSECDVGALPTHAWTRMYSGPVLKSRAHP